LVVVVVVVVFPGGAMRLVRWEGEDEDEEDEETWCFSYEDGMGCR
jgi:hypothetical protein